MKLRKLLVLVGIVFMTLSLLVACVDKKAKPREEIRMTQEEKTKIRKQQEALALFLVNNFEGIKKIEFTDISGGGFGVSDSVDVLVNDEITLYTFLQDSYETYGLSYNKGGKELVSKKQKTTITSIDDLDVEIYYFEDNK